MVPWFCGSAVLRFWGSGVPQFRGSTVLRFCSSGVPQFCGSEALRFECSAFRDAFNSAFRSELHRLHERIKLAWNARMCGFLNVFPFHSSPHVGESNPIDCEAPVLYEESHDYHARLWLRLGCMYATMVPWEFFYSIGTPSVQIVLVFLGRLT